jgi:large subunit ribosomal protein L30
LKECGDCVVIKEIENLQKRVEAAEKYEKEPKMDSDLLKKDSRYKWLNPW